MLAVQRPPMMGSSQPPSDPRLPFGYTFDADPESLLDPPEPAPGQPLLSEHDNKFLSCFFENFNTNQYNMPSFGEGLSLNDSWFGLPPQFMGSTTSFGQQPDASLASPDAQRFASEPFNMANMASESLAMPPPPPPPHAPTQLQSELQSPSQIMESYQNPRHAQEPLGSTAPQLHQDSNYHHPPDVLTAAATLLQNGSALRSGAPAGNAYGILRRPVGPPVGHLRHQPLEEFKEENRRSMLAQENDTSYNDWILRAAERRPSHHPALAGLQWGSDSNFSSMQAYTPESSKESAEIMQQEQLKVLKCFEVAPSTATTRPSSPENRLPPGSNKTQTRTNSDPLLKQEEVDAPSRKRRKSRNTKEEMTGDDDEDTLATKSSRRRKSKAEAAVTPASPTTENIGLGKRRKSGVSGSKTARENLSEEQKRENHIRSEQKRRTLIKEGFDDLCELVPGLKGGGFSKSTMLAMAAAWLEELLNGNQELAAQLSTLERSCD